MTIASCPKCHEQVAMPRGASPRASVRCPLCLEQFQLAEIIDSLPPTLEVIDDPEADGRGGRGESFGVATDFELVDDSADIAVAAPAISIERSAASPTATTASPRRRKGPVRAPRKKKNAAVEVVKVVLGGIAGLLIAQLILWWMPWQDLRRDPFDLGPNVAKYAPWLVPSTFHGKVGAAALSANGPDSPAGRVPGAEDLSANGLPQRTFDNVDAQDARPPIAEPGQRKPAAGKKASSEPPRVEAEQPEVAVDPDLSDLTAELPSTSDAPGLDSDLLDLDASMTEGAELETDPGLDVESDPQPSFAPEPATGPASTTVSDLPDDAAGMRRRIRSAPQFSEAEMRAAADDVRPVIRALEQATGEEAAGMVTKSYRSLTKLGETATFADDVGVEDREQAVQLLLSLAENPNAVPMLGRAGAAWLTAGRRRANSGILLVGAVRSTTQQGELFRTELVLPDKTTVVAVYSQADPSTVYQPNDTVLIVGAVVEQPSDELAGYTGQDQTVVWGPFAHIVPE